MHDCSVYIGAIFLQLYGFFPQIQIWFSPNFKTASAVPLSGKSLLTVHLIGWNGPLWQKNWLSTTLKVIIQNDHQSSTKEPRSSAHHHIQQVGSQINRSPDLLNEAKSFKFLLQNWQFPYVVLDSAWVVSVKMKLGFYNITQTHPKWLVELFWITVPSSVLKTDSFKRFSLANVASSWPRNSWL
jgi:hypothetical protein